MSAVTSSSASSGIAQQGFRRGGRGNMGAPVEKPQNGKQTLLRLAAYFAPERKYVLLLAGAVILAVAASVLAPRLQSQAIDHLVQRNFDRIPGALTGRPHCCRAFSPPGSASGSFTGCGQSSLKRSSPCPFPGWTATRAAMS